ncbi:inverse autotransporter beta domain-containing protein [Yersinia frederiksenii]|uniref:inverse autotransporter beta domain-containing protein n=1 Tax=Yersinia frederiksenii TaxID=29484 RepID=UPI0005DDB3A4|nr:inverse autotransporter beta-barrel domain-containing protein [Yersinia frederiksenii]CQJ05541.1 invasin [Yersinia frederiksenii]
MNNPIRLSIIASLIMCGTIVAFGVTPDIALAESKVTRIYTVDSRTSLYQIALQSGVTVTELRKLNKGSLNQRDVLNIGESLLLPADSPIFPVDTTARKLIDSNLPELGMGNDPVPAASGEQKTASVAQTVGAQDWNNMTSDQMKNQAEGWVKNQAKTAVVDPLRQQAQEMLGKFGKAQVNLAVDDKGSLNKSSFSLFTPWYENDAMVAFSQAGVHDQDGRTIGNLGAGVRFDQGTWLAGANTFLDQDISRNHSRLGMGIELWTDNAKLASNYYHPLSGWKDSKDFDDYLERPARGFDVRFQGYLPAYQHIGASTVYEKYYGDEVALFGKDNLQKDPHAVTIGLDYTPVPLSTLKVKHKMGSESKNESQVELQLSYQIGTPLSKQLDPANVAAMRSLMGSRYDLVDRNYDIVLEYKEKASLSVDLAAVPDTLLEGDIYMMQPLMRSKYTITSVTWNGDTVPLSLTPTAGLNNPQGWQVTLPAWDAAPSATNRYTLSITIMDEKGHQATSNEVEIIVGQQRKSKLVLESASTLPASGLANDTLKLSTYLENHKGIAINDAMTKPVWTVINTATGEVVPLVTGAACSVDAQGKPVPCLRVSSEEVEVRDGVNYYLNNLVSTLAGTFIVTANLGTYGDSNTQTVTFTNANPSNAVVRAEIRDPSGVDLLMTGSQPLVGVEYQVVLFDASDVDITNTIPATNVHWLLNGTNTAGCNITLNDYDTGVTGYTFTPRNNANSNSGVACGDQGFGLKVIF